MIEQATPNDSSPRTARGPPPVMPVVAIGASAGGLEAASKLLDRIPPNTGMAFILVQHLDPTHKSLMVDLLARHTAMKIVEATDDSPLRPNQLHIIPPGRYLSVSDGLLHLTPAQAEHGARLPFDVLLNSLADTCARRTIGVILSGTGMDGSGGIARIKAGGGFVIAQEPKEADYDGMPRSAIATGLIDRVLPLRDIPQALIELASKFTIPPDDSGDKAATLSPAGLGEIISVLKDKTSHNFRQYKQGTLARRIERRMVLLGLERSDLSAYLELLQGDPAERDSLAKDLLINVTGFFRDTNVFDALGRTIIPDIIAKLPEHHPLRVWVAGCSTGEEAYSIAMICRDGINASGREIKLQVFASDVDPDAIATAREGLYSLDVAAVIPADKLARYFVKDDSGYRVTPAIRGDVVFTVQDVLSDPPFSRINLVSCRNLLIYLNSEAQAKAIAVFHFALNQGGVLVLGSSETVGNAEDRFEIIAKETRFYRHIARGRTVDRGLSLNFADMLPELALHGPSPSIARQTRLADICRRAVLASHAPAAVLIDRNRQCLFSMGKADRYLRVAPGYATLDVLAMATPALRTKLKLAIDKASKTVPKVDGGRARLTHDGTTIWFRVEVELIAGEDAELILICFIEEAIEDTGELSLLKRGDASRVAELERELEATQAELQTVIQAQEASSQEQKAINEEALSVNEEFQSTNEELLTSKEELQSLNEELTALNSQLQETLERQRMASDDLQNVLYSTNVGTLFLDLDLKIRFYTPAIKSLFNIIGGDVGRPLADLRPIASDPDLLVDARRVLADEAAIEREVSAQDDIWWLRRIFPYRAHDSRVEGVVITFADITERKQNARALEESKTAAEQANLAKSRFLAAASHDLRQPLQSLSLLQELLAQSVEGERAHKLVERLGQTLAAMSGMLNALLDINQIEAGVIEARPTAFPIANIIDNLRVEFSYLAQTRNLSLHIVKNEAIVVSDPHLLEQMIRNLLGNAIKYTKEGKILLGCRRRGDFLRIEIWDTGIGIAQDELHAIFEEFHQIDNDARERSRGLGLGLTIVQRLGQLLGTHIDVRSLPGKGSVFAITVASPLDGEPRYVAFNHDVDGAGEVADHHCKILIVDDDPDVLELLGQILTNDGHIVASAADGASALKLIAGGAIQPEILLTDYNLPNGMDGLDLMEKLRATLPHGLPAIILTGDIASETLTKIDAQNCIALNKPVKPQELRFAIESLLPVSQELARLALPAVDGRADTVAYVIDDDPDVRANIKEVLERDGRTVEEFESAEAFLSSYRSGTEGCLLIDVHLPGMSGIALLDALRARGDHLPAILITGRGDIGLAVKAMRTGACDFIEKPVGRLDLLASIGRAIDQSHDIRRIDAEHEAAADRVAGLTARQREIMELVLAGHPSKNIAADLGISQRTIENHRAAIMHKMAAKSLPELARVAQAAESYGHQGEGPPIGP